MSEERAKAQGEPLGNSEVNVRLGSVVALAHSFADDALHSSECLTLPRSRERYNFVEGVIV